MDRKTLPLLVIGALIGVGLGTLAFTSSPHWATGQRTQPSGNPAIGGPFNLTDQNGKRVTNKDYLGRYTLVFFGYTNCPDICPAGLQLISAALTKLGRSADDIVPIFITLDPERDTEQTMSQYMKSFDPRIVGLTGSPSEIAKVAKSYRVYFQKSVDESDPKKYSLDHSAIFYLMGKDGTLITPIPFTTDTDQLASQLSGALS